MTSGSIKAKENIAPKVSVILTSYNHAKYLRESIDSVINQTFVDFELLIWDDYSTDESWEIIKSYGDPRIKSFQTNETTYCGYINEAIERAQGEYIAIHHSDDIWELNKLEKQVAFLEKHSEIGAVFTNAQAIGEEGEPLGKDIHFYCDVFDQKNRTRHEWLRRFFDEGNALCHPSILIRKECYRHVGYYNVSSGLAQLPDLDMWIRLCLHYEIHVFPEKLVRFRVRDHESNTSGNRPETRIRSSIENYFLLQNYCNLPNFKELLLVFPEAKQYDQGEGSSVEFALAMLSLGNSSVKSLFAIRLLQNLISDPISSQVIKKSYQFDYKKYIQLSGSFDVFFTEKQTELLKQISHLESLVSGKDMKALRVEDLPVHNAAETKSYIQKILLKLQTRLSNKIIAYKIGKSGLFDQEWYLKEYPDVVSFKKGPIFHYVNFGAAEGRDPQPLFNSKWYLLKNKDVASSGINPFYHYIEHGWKEGRAPNSFSNNKLYIEKCQKSIDRTNKLICPPTSNQDKEKVDFSKISEQLLKKYDSDISKNITSLLSSLETLNTEKDKGTDCCDQTIINELKKTIECAPINNALKIGNYDITIIIPVHNQLACTLACVSSILQAKTKYSYEILIGDDASTDQTKEIFSCLHPLIKVVHQKENLGFVRSCNLTAKHAKGKYIVFLNNDTIVLPNWLDWLVEIFIQKKDAGLVGAKLLNLDGSLQEAGGIIWDDGSGWNYGKGDNEHLPAYNYVKEVDYCSGACIMLEKSFWDRLKGFDELYVPAYCEDSDLAFRVRARGKKVYYQPRCEVIHLEGKSHGTKLDSGLKSYQVVNNKKFLKKWNSLLIKEQGKCSSDLFRSRERSLNKKTMLIIDHYLPHYDQDAGSRTMWSYIKFFVNNGFSVKFLGDNWLETEPYQMELQQLGVEVLVGNWARLNWNNWLKENGIYLDYILVSRAHIGVKHLSKLKRKTNAKILFYGHDLLSRTLYNKFIDTGDNNALIESKKWKKLEKTIIDHVDVAYYPSFIEVECLKKEHPTQNIRVLPPYVFDASKRNKISQNRLGCNKILFVGGFRHSPNVEAIVWFVKEIWPNILHCFPDLTLTVVGSYPPDEVLALASNNITVTGFINDKALEECYCSHDLVIAPLLSGGGIKGKIIEALWYGLPVLTTPIGAEGIPEAGKYIKIVQPSDFFSSLKELIEEPKLLKVFSNNASQLIKQYYSEEALYSVLSKDINFV